MRRLTGHYVFITTVWLLSVSGCSPDHPEAPKEQTAHSHHGGKHHGHSDRTSKPVLMVEVEPAKYRNGEPVTLKLMIHRADGSMVSDFETVHERKVHLIIVREGLDQFAHIHPEIDGAGSMTASFSFPVGGKYFLYADHKPAGEMQATATAQVDVPGDAPTPEKLTPNVPGKVQDDDMSAEVAVGKRQSGGSTKLSFSLANEKGKPITDLEPYLGAMGHLVVVSADARQYVHAHPVTTDDPTNSLVQFEAHFPAAGTYKGWAQFQRRHKVHSIPFVIEVP